MNVLAAWRADLAVAGGRERCSPVRAVWLLLSKPGVLAVLLLRAQQVVYARRATRPLAFLIRSVAHAITGADFVPGCRVGPGLRLEHPNGVVFGTGAVLGARAFVCQRVTLGERLGEGRAPAYPVLGDDVFLGAGVTVLGDVHIGHGARVGACALLLRSVPPGSVVVGNPARVVGSVSPAPVQSRTENSALYDSNPGSARLR